MTVVMIGPRGSLKRRATSSEGPVRSRHRAGFPLPSWPRVGYRFAWRKCVK